MKVRLLLLFRALGAGVIAVSTTAGAGALHAGLRHPHHLVRDPVGFLLEPVTRLVDGKLGLEAWSAQQLRHPAVADRMLQPREAEGA